MLTEIMLPPLEAAELKEIRMRISEDYDVRRASMFLKLLRNSYSSSGKSFASQPFDIRKLFGLIQELEDRMANVVIENQDFETLIRHYDRPDAFFYADPPYFSTEDMYEVGFGWDDHVRLRETLGRIKGKFLLSYNDCPEIRELYDGFSLFDFSRTHSMAQRYEAGKEFKEAWQKLGLFDASHCSEDNDYAGKLLILKPSVLKDEFKASDYQLFYAESGFGCSPTASGRKVFGKFLKDGENTSFNRSDFLGVIKDECIPEWAAEKLAELEPPDEDESEGITMGGM